MDVTKRNLGRRVSGGLAALAALLSAPSAAAGPVSPNGDKPRPTPQSRMPPLPPAVIDDALAIGGEDIEGRKLRTRMTVPVTVNGQGPFRFVVDSGADTSVIGARAAGALALPQGRPVTLHGMTASSSVNRVLVDSLGLGGGAFRDLELPVLADRDLGAEGMLGIDALVQQRLLLDFEKRLISVEDARKPARRLDGEIVVVARRRRGQLILMQSSVNDLTVDAVIDTGSEITIGNLALRNRLVRGDRRRLLKVAVTGVTGVTLDLELARVAVLKLGPVTLRDVLVAFADVPPFGVFGLRDRPALLLGTDLMETFRRVSLDFRARKVRFQLRRCGVTSMVLSTSTMTHSISRLSSSADGRACRR